MYDRPSRCFSVGNKVRLLIQLVLARVHDSAWPATLVDLARIQAPTVSSRNVGITTVLRCKGQNSARGT